MMDFKPQPILYYDVAFEESENIYTARIIAVLPHMETGGMMWKITAPSMPTEDASHRTAWKIAEHLLPNGAKVINVKDIHDT